MEEMEIQSLHTAMNEFRKLALWIQTLIDQQCCSQLSVLEFQNVTENFSTQQVFSYVIARGERFSVKTLHSHYYICEIPVPITFSLKLKEAVLTDWDCC